MTKRYLALDCESGGVTNEHSLLTAYFVVLDEDLKTIYGELDLRVKPNDGMYHITPQAMEINGINLIEHDKVADTEGKAGQRLHEFLEKHSPKGTVKLTPLGHNVVFDIEFVKAHLYKNLNNYVSYRVLDTASTAQFLKHTGHLPKDLAGSLGELAKYLNVTIATLHTAKDDTWLTIKILERMEELVNYRGEDHV